MEQLEAIQKLAERFEAEHKRTPRVFRAPGRVNVIGEHTDYNEGFVFPFAIDRATFVAGALNDRASIKVTALDLDESAVIDLAQPAKKRRGSWIDYVEGTARSLFDGENERPPGCDLMITSTVPIGAGLSSSAALEVSIGYALLALADVNIDRRKLAFAAQRAEHEFVGIRSGIMDQFASVFGVRGRAMLLDCRSLAIRQILIDFPQSQFVICDTKVKHELASSAYNTRREECEQGLRLLSEKLPGITALRDVSVEDFEKFSDILPSPVKERVRHVVTENVRAVYAADAFERADLAAAGKLMFESHRSLRDDYQVSSAELDTLVEIARGVHGVFGARMTGGGFGGCTVNLVATDAVAEFMRQATARYEAKFGSAPDIYLFKAADGAGEA